MRLTHSLSIVVTFKFPLHLHQKYYIAQYEELGFSKLTHVRDCYLLITNYHYPTYTFPLKMFQECTFWTCEWKSQPIFKEDFAYSVLTRCHWQTRDQVRGKLVKLICNCLSCSCFQLGARSTKSNTLGTPRFSTSANLNSILSLLYIVFCCCTLLIIFIFFIEMLFFVCLLILFSYWSFPVLVFVCVFAFVMQTARRVVPARCWTDTRHAEWSSRDTNCAQCRVDFPRTRLLCK